MSINANPYNAVPFGPPPYYYPPYVQGPQLVPHKCPVCEGRGRVAEDFYGDENNQQPPYLFGFSPGDCRSCNNGVLWR